MGPPPNVLWKYRGLELPLVFNTFFSLTLIAYGLQNIQNCAHFPVYVIWFTQRHTEHNTYIHCLIPHGCINTVRSQAGSGASRVKLIGLLTLCPRLLQPSTVAFVKAAHMRSIQESNYYFCVSHKYFGSFHNGVEGQLEKGAGRHEI